MLPSGARMRTPSEFSDALRRGPGSSRAAAGGLVVHAAYPVASSVAALMPSGSASLMPRIGFVIPRAAGSAVVRNRLRRQLRALLRERLAILPPEARLVVRVSSAAAGSTSEQLGRDLDACLRRAVRRTMPVTATPVTAT